MTKITLALLAILVLAGCGASSQTAAQKTPDAAAATVTPSATTVTPSSTTALSATASASDTSQIKKCSSYVGQIDTAADAKVVCTDDYGHNLQALDQKCENGRQYLSFGQHAGAFVGQKVAKLAGPPVLDAHNCKLLSH